MDYSRFTPVDNTGTSYSPFKSAYKNIRFALRTAAVHVVTAADTANLVGIAFRTYGDVSFWRLILAYNGIHNAVQDIQPGVVLKLPNKADAIAYMNAQRADKQTSILI